MHSNSFHLNYDNIVDANYYFACEDIVEISTRKRGLFIESHIGLDTYGKFSKIVLLQLKIYH